MKRPAKWYSRQGLLLVEAVLSAVIMAAVLVFISRGLGGQLRALRTLQDYDALCALAESTLERWEAERLFGRSLPSDRSGTIESAGATGGAVYQWSVTVRQPKELLDENGQPFAGEVTLSIRRSDRASAAVSVRAVWPVAWIPSEWF